MQSVAICLYMAESHHHANHAWQNYKDAPAQANEQEGAKMRAQEK
jgi:hypothetical protein